MLENRAIQTRDTAGLIVGDVVGVETPHTFDGRNYRFIGVVISISTKFLTVADITDPKLHGMLNFGHDGMEYAGNPSLSARLLNVIIHVAGGPNNEHHN